MEDSGVCVRAYLRTYRESDEYSFEVRCYEDVRVGGLWHPR